jgi:hypothetical protein
MASRCCRPGAPPPIWHADSTSPGKTPRGHRRQVSATRASPDSPEVRDARPQGSQRCPHDRTFARCHCTVLERRLPPRHTPVGQPPNRITPRLRSVTRRTCGGIAYGLVNVDPKPRPGRNRHVPFRRQEPAGSPDIGVDLCTGVVVDADADTSALRQACSRETVVSLALLPSSKNQSALSQLTEQK